MRPPQNKDPFRRNAPPLFSKRRLEETPINPEFKDISNPKEMLDFINRNRQVLAQQDAEIDNLEGQVDLVDEPEPQAEPLTALRNPRRIISAHNREQQISPLQRNAEKPQSFQGRPIVEEELEQTEYDDQQYGYEDELTEQTQSPQQVPSSRNKKSIDDPNNILSKINTEGLPPEAIERILAVQKDNPRQKVISNVNEKGVAQAPPPISPVQMRRQIEREYREELKTKGTSSLEPPKTQMRFSINLPDNAIEYDWERFEPVSGCIFYESSEMFVRRFNLIDTNRVTSAMLNEDISAFIDAIGNTVQQPMNVRDLSWPDFRNLLYWHWFNSYTKIPHDLKWTSKYGNENIYKVSATNLKMRTPKITREEYEKWTDLGYSIPTVRDAEVFMKEDLSKEERDLLQKAQYFQGDVTNPSIQSKIDTMVLLCAKTTEPIQLLSEFREAVDHEIVENVDVVDAKFDPHAWIEVLSSQVKSAKNDRDRYASEGDNLSLLGAEDEITELEEEIERLQSGIDNGEKEVALADLETVRLDRAVLNFFPIL